MGFLPTQQLKVDNISLEIAPDGTLRVKDGGIAPNKFKAKSVLGSKVFKQQTNYYSNYTANNNYIYGQRIKNFTGAIDKLVFKLTKTGSPTGTSYVRVYRTSDKAILSQVSFDVSSLPSTTSDIEFTLPSTLYLENQDIIIAVVGIGSSDTIQVGYHNADVIANENLIYSSNGGTNWAETTSNELYYKIITFVYGNSEC
jgi:hypothetical protein